jgi:hypothetical protein
MSYFELSSLSGDDPLLDPFDLACWVLAVFLHQHYNLKLRDSRKKVQKLFAAQRA